MAVGLAIPGAPASLPAWVRAEWRTRPAWCPCSSWQRGIRRRDASDTLPCVESGDSSPRRLNRPILGPIHALYNQVACTRGARSMRAEIACPQVSLPRPPPPLLHPLSARCAAADVLFSIKPFSSTNHVLSVRGSRFKVRCSMLLTHSEPDPLFMSSIFLSWPPFLCRLRFFVSFVCFCKICVHPRPSVVFCLASARPRPCPSAPLCVSALRSQSTINSQNYQLSYAFPIHPARNPSPSRTHSPRHVL